MKKFTALTITTLLIASLARCADFFVAPDGSDANPGSSEKPFGTLQRAQQAVRKAKASSKVVVNVRGGVYYLADTLVFTAEDSGGTGAEVLWQAVKGETPVISGGVKLDLAWEPHRDGILKAKVPPGLVTDQLFVNGERQILARYPNFDPNVRIFNGYAKDAISPERAARWSDPRGGFIHVMHEAMWGGMHYVITGRDAQGKLTYEGGWQNNRPSGMHKEYRFVENIFEELDSPGEWFLDAKSSTLYFFPPKNLDLTKATVEAVRLKHLMEFRGDEDHPARFIYFKGFTFRHAARTFMENREPLLRSDWTTYRGGAVFYNGAEDCVLENCFIDQVGGNAVFVSGYARSVDIRGCHIAKVGANGAAFVGKPDAVREPLTWKDHRDFAAIDKEPGPKTNNYPADCSVENCLIYLTGRVEKQTAPVEIDMASSIDVRHCSIYDAPRAGINIGDGCWGGHVVEFCDVFDTVMETGDLGSFNSWGRDRFWGLGGIDLNTVTLGENKDLPRLDVFRPIVLRNNRWRCDHGWDIDLDDGSSHYEIRNNLCLNGGLKNREGFYRIVENNIIVNNSFHPHVWYGNSQDVFRFNIVFTAYRPVEMKQPWGRDVDFNLLHQTGAQGTAPATKLQEQSGRDAHSIVADAMFTDPATGDYTVKDGSPVKKLGFQNFPMNLFGVTRPELKAIARTPQLPGKEPPKPVTRRDAIPREWLGAKVRNIADEGEMSVHGTPEVTGVLVVELPDGTPLAAAGAKKDDVILLLNLEKVNDTGDLASLLDAAKPGVKFKVVVLRNQQPLAIEVEKK